MEIKRAEIEDIPLLARVGIVFHKDAGFDKVQTYDEVGIQDKMLELISNPMGILLIAWEGDKFAGAMAGGLYPNFYNPNETIAQTGFVCVMPEYRKSKAAKELVKAFEAWAQEQGASVLVYMSNTDAWTKALEKRGSIKTDVVMSKRIAEG